MIQRLAVFILEIQARIFLLIAIVKDKEHLDFDELLKDMKLDENSNTVNDFVKQNIVPNSYRDREKEIINLLK